MKLWLAYWQNDSEGRCQTWHLTHRDAQRALEETEKGASGPYGFDRYDVPATKRGFVDFLNAHFTKDNG